MIINEYVIFQTRNNHIFIPVYYLVNKFLVVNLFIFYIIDYFNYKTALQ